MKENKDLHTHNKERTDTAMCNSCVIEKHNRQAELNACDCLTSERKEFIQSAMDFSDDFNDGAFMAYMEEHGIDVSELECFSTTHYAENHKGKP